MCTHRGPRIHTEGTHTHRRLHVYTGGHAYTQRAHIHTGGYTYTRRLSKERPQGLELLGQFQSVLL